MITIQYQSDQLVDSNSKCNAQVWRDSKPLHTNKIISKSFPGSSAAFFYSLHPSIEYWLVIEENFATFFWKKNFREILLIDHCCTRKKRRINIPSALGKLVGSINNILIRLMFWWIRLLLMETGIRAGVSCRKTTISCR
jgi:hypothetical protein